MSSVSASHVKQLRQETGAGFMSCKEALSASGSDFEKAKQWLREKGLSTAVKKSSRQANEGLVFSYIHGEGRLGVLIEVNSETDFAARNEHFKKFVRQLSLHVAAMNPVYVKEDDIPEEVLKKEKEIFREQAQAKTKKTNVIEKISEGLYEKWLEQVCLLNQEFVRDSEEKKQKVGEALKDLIARLGENVVICRFVRFVLGETSETEKK